MIKKMWLHLLSVVILVSCVSLQSTPMNPDDVTYQRVVESGIEMDEAYARALNWFADEFRSAEAVIQVNDPESSLIIGKAFFDVGLGEIWFTTKVENKEGRSRITFYDIYVEVTVSTQTVREPLATVEGWEKYRPNFEELADSFEKTIATTEEDW